MSNDRIAYLNQSPYDADNILGVGRRPSDEELHQRVRELEAFIPDARGESLVAIKAERDGILMALGLRPGKLMNDGRVRYNRTEGEAAMDQEWLLRWNRPDFDWG